MLYCTSLYGIVLYSSFICVCNSCVNSYLAFLLLLHITYIVYLLYFWCCHDSLNVWCLLLCLVFVMWRNLWHLLFYHHMQYLEQPSPMQTMVYCVSKSCRSMSNTTQSSLNFCGILMYDMLFADVCVLITLVC